MTNDEMAAIKARHLRDDWWRHSPSMLSPKIHDDRGALLAEVERLRAALEDIARGDYSDPMCQRTPEARARAALEGGR